MADGPVANLPPGFDAYAGYVDASGIGVTFPDMVARFPAARHLSISVHGMPADCADVENGAMTSWKGYTVGYCSVSSVNFLVARDGRPRKLWTAHYNHQPHLCSPDCWPGLVTTADATQWNDPGAYDESQCADDFFDFQDPPAKGPPVYYILETTDTNNAYLVEFKLGTSHRVWIPDPAALTEFQKTLITVRSSSAYAGALPLVGDGPAVA